MCQKTEQLMEPYSSMWIQDNTLQVQLVHGMYTWVLPDKCRAMLHSIIMLSLKSWRMEPVPPTCHLWSCTTQQAASFYWKDAGIECRGQHWPRDQLQRHCASTKVSMQQNGIANSHCWVTVLCHKYGLLYLVDHGCLCHVD